MIRIKANTSEGYYNLIEGGMLNATLPGSTTRRGRVIDNGTICPTLLTQQEVVRMESEYVIRRITPRECWRLMDFTDKDYEAAESVVSKMNLYKQAGNSIVVNVLVAIIGQMIEGKEDMYKERI
jgi:DNA (cytosine-5)-methyltransferase 1